MLISVIIPTYNEAENLKKLIPYLKLIDKNKELEIIVVDGGSIDDSLSICKSLQVQFIKSPQLQRAAQMNLGAKAAQTKILYFLHADCVPPKTLIFDLLSAYAAKAQIGSYQLSFDKSNIPLKINSWFTSLPFLWCRGGDQSLYINRELFFNLNGFDEEFCIMEEYDLIKRAKRTQKFFIMNNHIVASTRKYVGKSYLKVNMANLTAYLMFSFGINPDKIKDRYSKMLN